MQFRQRITALSVNPRVGDYLSPNVQHVTGTGSGLLGGIPRVVVQISALTLKGPL